MSLRSDPARIVLVRLSHLGDVVLALPLFHALRERFPRAELAWLVQPEFAPLVEGLPHLARTIRFKRRRGLAGWVSLREELASFSAELAIDAQGNAKSGFALAITGAPRRVGLARRDWREKIGRFALTESAARAHGEHAFERTLALCRHFGFEGVPRRDPLLSRDELRSGHEAARGLGLRAGSLLLQLSPTRDVRSWPVARAEALVRELAHEGRAVAVLSGPAEVDEGNELERRTRDVPLVRHWVGQRGLRALAGFFGACAELGASYLGCDTGPTHLAAACGLPVTVLCGPHSHLRTGPWPVARLASESGAAPHVALRAAVEPECAPCFARRCTHREGPVCMAQIDSDRVRMALAAPART